MCVIISKVFQKWENPQHIGYLHSERDGVDSSRDINKITSPALDIR